jgi:hypothetical protein
MDDGEHVVVREGSSGRSVRERGVKSESIAIACAEADVLVDEVDEVAMSEAFEEAGGVAPALGNGAIAVGEEIDVMRLGGIHKGSAEIGEVAGVTHVVLIKKTV